MGAEHALRGRPPPVIEAAGGGRVTTWRHADGRDWDGALAVFADVAARAER
jgi:hypothetical protein